MLNRELARADPEELWPSHLPRGFKKKVAFFGGGYTRLLILDHPLVDDDCEIWSGNAVWKEWAKGVVELDRCFDIHEVGLLESYSGEGDQRHFVWLQEEHPFPIYMQNPDDRFPSAVRYPYEEVCENIFSKVYRGAEPKRAFGSTIDFMAGLAMHEGYDWIGYFGIEMGAGTEYRYQVPDAHFHLGFAAGRDITIWMPDDPRCRLLNRQVYAYEGFQMISRHTLERLDQEYEKQRRDWLNATNTWVGAYRLSLGQLEEARKNGNSKEQLADMEKEAIALGEKVRRAREATAMASGAKMAVKALIQTVDLEEPDTEIRAGLMDELPMEDEQP